MIGDAVGINFVISSEIGDMLDVDDGFIIFIIAVVGGITGTGEGGR